jgi:hypothetical protein
LLSSTMPVDVPPINRIGKYYYGGFIFDSNSGNLVSSSIVDFDVIDNKE